MAITAEERRRQRRAYQQDVPPAKNTALSRLRKTCSFQVKYRQLEFIIIGLFGIIGGIWLLVSWLEIRFLGFLGPW